MFSLKGQQSTETGYSSKVTSIFKPQLYFQAYSYGTQASSGTGPAFPDDHKLWNKREGWTMAANLAAVHINYLSQWYAIKNIKAIIKPSYFLPF